MGQKGGHYESYFLRANHPDKPMAFWIRHTIFSPKKFPERAIGELWAVFFDGETQKIVAAKKEYALSQCEFSRQGLNVRLPDGFLKPGQAQGSVQGSQNRLAWDLTFGGADRPLRLLPETFYERKFPKAKALVASPNAQFDGRFSVNGESIAIEDWVGSENHNWGSQHTDEYAWGQVAGFDNAPTVFLECATARLKFGPVWTPRFTTLVLRVGDRDFRMNSLWQSLKANGRYGYFNWHIETATKDVRILAHFHAGTEAFAGLNYLNPPGGSSTCLNSKIAFCRVVLQERGQPERVFETAWRGAFEILTKDIGHGIAVLA
ncbi:conserved hypothetical protein [gamma proteobacterium HdN1]|nr:conserved hypothetical protein [gamma proteobacterium HdN1]